MADPDALARLRTPRRPPPVIAVPTPTTPPLPPIPNLNDVKEAAGADPPPAITAHLSGK